MRYHFNLIFFPIIFLVIIFSFVPVHGQHLLTPWAFSSAQGSMKLSLSAGEAFSSTLRSTGSVISVGFHQGKPDLMSSTGDTMDEDLIHVFPNPAQNILHIRAENGITKVEFLNPCGSLMESALYNGQKEVALEISLPSGIYFMQTRLTNGLIKVRRVVII